MKQRDVELLFQRYGFERGSVQVCMRLAEENEAMIKTVKEMALAFEQLTTVITMQNTVVDKMKDNIDGMQRHFDTDPRSTHAIVRSTKEFDDE